MHCLYIERVDGEKNAEKISCLTVGEMQLGIIKQQVQERFRKRADKRLLRIVKKHCNRETIITGNEKAMGDFELPNTLFDLRKQELLKNVGRIVKLLQSHISKKKRKKLLVVLHSEKWNKCEMCDLLLEVKKYYEDIYIVYQGKKAEMESIADYFYRECGVELHLYYEQDGRSLEVDTVLFLVKEWSTFYQQFGYRNGYVIAEQEQGIRRRKMGYEGGGMKCLLSDRMLYAGLAYKCERKEIPYELALPIVYHDGLRHVTALQKEEKEISIVAIYGLE